MLSPTSLSEQQNLHIIKVHLNSNGKDWQEDTAHARNQLEIQRQPLLPGKNTSSVGEVTSLTEASIEILQVIYCHLKHHIF